MKKRIRFAALCTLAMLPAVVGHAAEGGSGGMPQLDFGNPMTISQVVWLFIIFAVLYGIMSKVALPGVAAVLEERRRRIDGDLEVAQAAKQRADAAMSDHQAATARARGEAQAAIATATQQAQLAAAARGEALNAQLSAQIDAAEQRIGASRDAAMGALRQVASETAVALVARLTGGADNGAVERAVDRELAVRGRA
jgi:F-type H+-transporting ATPase subunit b